MPWSPCRRCKGQAALEAEHPHDPPTVPHIWNCLQCGHERFETEEEVVKRAGVSRAQVVAALHEQVRRELAEETDALGRRARRWNKESGAA